MSQYCFHYSKTQAFIYYNVFDFKPPRCVHGFNDLQKKTRYTVKLIINAGGLSDFSF